MQTVRVKVQVQEKPSIDESYVKGYSEAYKLLKSLLDDFVYKIQHNKINSDVEATDYWILAMHRMFLNVNNLEAELGSEEYKKLLRESK